MNSDRTQSQIGSHGPALRAFQRQAVRRISSVLRLAATPATCLSHTCGVSLEVTGVWPRLRGEGSKVVRVGGARPLMKAPWEFRFAME
jgi:hypothetical protein